MKGGQFIRLGYTAGYARPQGGVRAIPSTPEPEISGITPNVPTTFVNIRTLKARIPAGVVARALGCRRFLCAAACRQSTAKQ